MKKLYFYGTHGKRHAWITDYLSNRKHLTHSLFKNLKSGLNNSTSKLSAILFADEINLFCSGKDLQELESIVNTELTGVQEWLTLNQLSAK